VHGIQGVCDLHPQVNNLRGLEGVALDAIDHRLIAVTASTTCRISGQPAPERLRR